MPEELFNNRKALPNRHSTGSECVPKIRDADIREVGEFADPAPWLLHVRKMLTFNITYDYMRIVSPARYDFERLYRD